MSEGARAKVADLIKEYSGTPTDRAWEEALDAYAADKDREIAALREMVERLRVGIGKHRCGVGSGALWCGEHHEYHLPDIDALLATPTVQTGER